MGKDKKLPAFQWYAGDWRKDLAVQSLSFHDRGVWREMLDLMHDSERRGVLVLNGRAMTDDQISRAIGLDNQSFNQTLSRLLTSGVASREEETGAIFNRRMVRDEELRKIRTSAGKKGGNPVLLNQICNQNIAVEVKHSGEDEDVNETVIEITPDMVASAVIQDLRISGRNLRIVLEEIARNDISAGKTAEQVRDGMIDAYHELQKAKPSLQFVKGLEKFYGEGDWRDSKTWPWKEKRGDNPKTAAEWEEFGRIGGKK